MSEFAIGAYVRKKAGAFWEGTVVGRYSTRQTDDGVAVQLFGWDDGPVQIYPASALEPCDPAEGRLAPQLLTINLSEDELAELQAAARNSAPGKITVATPPPQTHVEVVEALRAAEPYVEICHSLISKKDTRAQVWKVLKQIRAALASTEGKS